MNKKNYVCIKVVGMSIGNIENKIGPFCSDGPIVAASFLDVFEERDELQKEMMLTENRLDEMKILLVRCIEAMEMQEKRESGEFHISTDSFAKMWKGAKEGAKKAVSELEMDETSEHENRDKYRF